MRRWHPTALRVAVVAFLVSAFASSAHAQGGRPFGSVYGGLGYGGQWGYNWYGNDYDSPRGSRNPYNISYVPPSRPAPVSSGPYLTSQTYEPGDGYRYPLYYDPASSRYIYYPVAR